jgi:hypothetical protein
MQTDSVETIGLTHRFQLQTAGRDSGSLDVRRLLALRTLLYFKADLLILLKALEAVRLDFREMCEQIVAAIIGRDEAKTLCIVEPLDRTGCHERIQI